MSFILNRQKKSEEDKKRRKMF